VDIVEQEFSNNGSSHQSHSVYLIEAQSLFVPTLADVFREAGFELRGVSGDADARTLLDAQPDVVFVDIDYVQQEPVRLVRVLRTLLPRTAICIYTSISKWVKGRHFPGATVVFGKNEDRQQIVAALRTDVIRPA
jgi:DNA-binding NarL/FixJ family response regulator